MKAGPPLSEASLRRRGLVLLLTAIACTVAVWLGPPIHQDLGYHQFADTRTLLAVPNALNVLSNLPFAVVGLLGLHKVWVAQAPSPLAERGQRSWFLVLFGGIFLTAFGSAYYHYAPDSRSLFWDRLPMTLGFMSLFALVLKERVSVRLGDVLAGPLVLLGLASVSYWRWGDASGHGDLRLYVLVQFYPLLSLPLILWLFPPRYAGTRELVVTIGWYALAKALEVADARIFALTSNLVSGHSLKHLAAATATWFLVRMADARQRGDHPGSPPKA